MLCDSGFEDEQPLLDASLVRNRLINLRSEFNNRRKRYHSLRRDHKEANRCLMRERKRAGGHNLLYQLNDRAIQEKDQKQKDKQAEIARLMEGIGAILLRDLLLAVQRRRYRLWTCFLGLLHEARDRQSEHQFTWCVLL